MAGTKKATKVKKAFQIRINAKEREQLLHMQRNALQLKQSIQEAVQRYQGMEQGLGTYLETLVKKYKIDVGLFNFDFEEFSFKPKG